MTQYDACLSLESAFFCFLALGEESVFYKLKLSEIECWVQVKGRGGCRVKSVRLSAVSSCAETKEGF